MQIMQIKRNGKFINYYPPDTIPHKETGCMGCTHRDNKDCGRIEADRTNGGMVYRKVKDERCKHGCQ